MTRIQERPGVPATEDAFTRSELDRGAGRRLHEGRWANAVVYLCEHAGTTWVVKDFRPRAWLVRNIIGRLLVRREIGALRKLAGLPGTPQGAFRVDAFALAYRFVPGRGLRRAPAAAVGPEFFPALERNIRAMHAHAGIVHLDMRNADNILVTDAGEPVIIDFQSHVGLGWMPGPLRRFALRVDHAAIYKHWARLHPATLGPDRAAVLDRINELRPLWALRGYLGSSRSGQRKP